MNKTTLNIIALTHPFVREALTIIINLCNAALKGRAQIGLTFGWRSAAEQNALYALGRTVVNPDGKRAGKPMGNIVTNAKAWQSIHCYGLAVDMVLIIDGKSYKWDELGDYDGDGIADWMECVAIFKAHGWEWGGDWTTIIDKPHFQFDYGYSWQQLKVLHGTGKMLPGNLNYVDLVRTPVNDPTLFRTSTTVNLRSGANTTYAILQVLYKGEHVKELSRSGAWSKVQYGSKIGYISNQYLIK